MYLRWMIRKDHSGVDFGLWNSQLLPSHLMCPLDVHSGNVGRKLGLLKRTQNDWKALDELTINLRKFDTKDPCKYDARHSELWSMVDYGGLWRIMMDYARHGELWVWDMH